MNDRYDSRPEVNAIKIKIKFKTPTTVSLYQPDMNFSVSHTNITVPPSSGYEGCLHHIFVAVNQQMCSPATRKKYGRYEICPYEMLCLKQACH